MDLGHVAVGAFGGDDFVGDIGVGGNAKVAGMGRVWRVVGLGAHDEPGAGDFAAVFVGLGGVSGARGEWLALETSGACGWTRDFVLCAVDNSELRGVSQVHSSAVEFAV